MRKNTWLTWTLILGWSIIAFLPLMVVADYIDANGVLHTGLVQCDSSVPIGSPNSCDMCALLKTIQEVFKYIIGAIFVGATGILVYNGVLFYFSQGQPGNVKKIIDNIKNVVIGIIIVMASFIVVNTIFNWFAAPGSIPTFWNNIQCVPGAGGPGASPTPTPACEGADKVCKPACISFFDVAADFNLVEFGITIGNGTWREYIAGLAGREDIACPTATFDGGLCILIPELNFHWPLDADLISYQEPIPGTCENPGEICCSL